MRSAPASSGSPSWITSSTGFAPPRGRPPFQIDRAWVVARLQTLNDLLASDPAGARREIQKHLEDLRVAPAPDVGERVVRVTGRTKIDGLLGAEEAVRLQLVAGARNSRHYTQPPWPSASRSRGRPPKGGGRLDARSE